MERRTRLVGHNYGGLLAAVCATALLILPAKVARAQSSSDRPGQDQSPSVAQSATQSSARPNLAGTWKLNKDQSDDPRQKMREAMGAPGGQGGQGAEGGSGARPGAGRPGKGMGAGGGMMAEWSELNIGQTDTNIKVTGASGRLLATSEAETKTQNDDENGGVRFPPATAQWQGNRLIAKGHGFGGGTTTRTFELSPDGKQLNVTTKIENDRLSEPVTYKLVYDRGKAEVNNQ